MDFNDLYRLALAAIEQGDFFRAEKILLKFAFQQKHAAALNLLAVMQTLSGKHDQALEAFKLSIASDPSSSDTHNNLGSLYLNRNQLLLAKSSYETAISLNQKNADAINNLGTVLLEMDQAEEAAQHYKNAISLNPTLTAAHINLGNSQKELGRYHQALQSYQEAILLDPQNVDARFNRALVLLKLGNFKEGWADHELRWRRRGNPPGRPTTRPQWVGEKEIQGQSVLIWGEQGLGDQIMMARYIPSLVERGADVFIEVDKPLIRLFRHLPGVNKVGAYNAFGDTTTLQCPIMSLPLAFGTTLQNIPCAVPYFSIPSERLDFWEIKLGPRRKPRIGVMWSGGTHGKIRNRSISLVECSSLFTEEFEWISLQKDVRDSDQDTLKQLKSLRHFGEEQEDFLDAAALCKLVDLVITVDTSMAHLAGALARPTWVLLPISSDWRWLTEGESSPWYPSARLFRQRQSGAWAHLLDQVRSELSDLLTSTL